MPTIGRDFSDTEEFLYCLAGFREQKARMGFATNVLPHVSCGVFVVADERDMRDILECCSGMAFVTAETLKRGELAAVVTGTLAQWRASVAAGCVGEVDRYLRTACNKLYDMFCGAGLDVWHDYRSREAFDGTRLLDYKP